MGGHAAKNLDTSTLWGGKLSPYSTSYGKMMMWFFLVSDALTFGGLLTAYGFIRHSYTGEWPIGEEVFHHFPFMGETPMPLIYVAFMTFVLIVSSVTMVLAVEAGHRNDKRGVLKWMIATIIGGFIFLGSQVWEWSHFIHGSHFGKVQLEDGSYATVEGEFGAVEKLVYVDPAWLGHDDHGHGHMSETPIPGHPPLHEHHEGIEEELTGGHADHEFRHAVSEGHIHHAHHEIKDEEGNLVVKEGDLLIQVKEENEHHLYVVHKKPNKIEKLVVRSKGSEYSPGKEIKGEEAQEMYEEIAYNTGEPSRVIFGAHLKDNEYGPVQYGQFFFFITGFHGFHVFSGVVINIIIFFQALGGVFERRGHYEMIEKVGLYWHFVDLVWVFVFTFFYLI